MESEIANTIISWVDDLFGREMSVEQIDSSANDLCQFMVDTESITGRLIFNTALNCVDGYTELPNDVYENYVDSVSELLKSIMPEN